MNFKQSFHEELSKDILARAKKYGATSAEVTLNLEAGFSVSARLGQVETVEHHQDKGMAVTVYVGQQTGSTSTTDLSLPAIEMAVQKACEIAKFTNSDPFSGLADKDLMAFDYPELHLDHSWDITPETALELAIECENLARKDPRITNSEGASVSSHRSLFVYANTYDFMGSYLATQHSINCVLIAQQNNQMHRDYEYTVARDPKDLTSIEELARSVTQKTTQRLGAKRLTTRTAPVIFSAHVAKSLLSNLISAMNGNNIYRDSSFLVGQLGTKILPERITLKQQPHLLGEMGSIPFDSEGVRTQAHDYVKNGILSSYILSTYPARKLGMKSTGNSGGVYNFTITSDNVSLEELIRQMDTGLLVTELIGQGVNTVTGDYSRGAFGYWIERGEIMHPVEEITIAGNLMDMFRNIVAVANDTDRRSRIHTGSILIENMTIAGE